MFRGYLGEPERYAKCFADGWYLSCALAKSDAGGDYRFLGRAYDTIKSADHIIGPFEVESVLTEHPVLAEAGVIGIPHEAIGEVVKAFAALKPRLTPTASLERVLLPHARLRLGPAVAPRVIVLRQNLPKTRSGKVTGRPLRARELGLAEGEVSALESDVR